MYCSQAQREKQLNIVKAYTKEFVSSLKNEAESTAYWLSRYPDPLIVTPDTRESLYVLHSEDPTQVEKVKGIKS